MTPSSRDLRLRIVQAYTHQEGSMRQFATRFCVSLGGVRALLKRYRATGDVAPLNRMAGALRLNSRSASSTPSSGSSSSSRMPPCGTVYARAGDHTSDGELCHHEPCLDEAGPTSHV
jgi:hypothetical protein